MLIPRLVSELELDVIDVFLPGETGQGGQGRIGSLQDKLRYIKARIKGTYKEVFMEQHGHCLHTMMVHKAHNWEYQHFTGDI